MAKYYAMGIFLALALVGVPAFALSPLESELVYRVSFGRADDVKLLLDKQVSPDTVNEQGWPVLSVAADRSDKEALPIVTVLVEAGANVNASDKAKHYPLLNAVERNNADVAEYLITHGADVYVRDNENYDLRTLASNLDHPAIVKLIDAKIQADQDELARQKSPQNLNRLVREFAFNSCEAEYWSYYLASKQDADANEATLQGKIDALTTSLSQSQTEIMRLFSAKPVELATIANNTRRAVHGDLDALVSNRNRKGHGIGTETDMNRRCTQLSNMWSAQYTAAPK